MLIRLLVENPLLFVVIAVILLMSIAIHEFAHAFAADKLGDPTPRFLGRVTLNPLAHLDPIGSLLLLVIGFGWGKPVTYNPANLRKPKQESALISLAGPAANIIIVLITTVLAKVIGIDIPLFRTLGGVVTLSHLVVFYNLVLAVFNMIPVYPLDGAKVVYGLLPMNLAWQWEQMQEYGMYFLMFLIITGATSQIINPIINFLSSLFGYPSVF